MGGTYESRNVIRVNVAMHAFLHKCLWNEHGDMRDFHAWKMLTGLIGKGPRQQTEETKAKLRAFHMGRPNSEDSKEKNRIASTGRKHSPETIEKMRAAQAGRPKSAETKAKLRAATKAAWASFSPEKQEAINAKRRAFWRKGVH